jgi:arylsulfatase
MIAHWPKGLKTPVGSVTSQPAHLVDFMATLMDLSGANYPKQIGDRTMGILQGKSLLPIFKGEQREGHKQLYFHFGSDKALRQGPWKLVSAKNGRWELYNLDRDRSELNDLSGKFPEKVEAMSKEWYDLAENVDRLKGKALAPVSDKIKELSFRKDTSKGSVVKVSKKTKKK